MTSNNTPKFAQLHLDEIQKLATAGATGKTIAVYACIVAHDYKKKCSAFPSIATLQKLSGLTERAVYRCLAWLRKNGIIEQNHKSSKQRFVLIFRKTVEWGFETMKKHVKSDSKRQRRHVRNQQKKRQGKRRDNYYSKQKEIDNRGYDKVTKDGVVYLVYPDGKSIEERHQMWMRTVALATRCPSLQTKILSHPQMQAPPDRLTMEIVRRHMKTETHGLAQELLAGLTKKESDE